MDSLKKKSLHGVVWSAIERFSVQGIQFIIQLIMARLLLPSDYGLIGMLAIFMSLSQVFIDGGFSNALIQKKNRNEADYTTVFYINISISILIYIFLFAIAPWIAEFYNQPLLSSITRIYSLNLIINSLVAVNKVKLIVAVDFKTQSKISLIAVIISGIVGIMMAYKGMGVWSLVCQMLLSSLLNVIFSFYFVRWFPKLFISRDSFNSLFKFGSKLLVASIISSIYSNLYNLVIGKKFDSSSLGFYTRANQFTSFATTNISAILQRVSFPVLSEIQDDNIRLIKAYKKYIQVTTWVVFPVILGLCGVADPLIRVLLTDKWIDCVPLLQILSFAYMWDCVISVNLNLLYVKGRSDLVLKLEVVKKTIAFTILVITLFFNLYIICIGQVVYNMIALYLNSYYTDKLFHYNFSSQIKEIFPQLVLSLFMMLICLLIVELISNPYISLFISIVSGIVVYLIASKMLKLEAFHEFCLLFKR